MTTREAIVELEDWIHELERGRGRLAAGGRLMYDYDSRVHALRLAIRALREEG
uniref:Uncharacterized protein n=1 Tax=viral metagenome TaxID=1070528 RepID=A0A6M3LYC3_9ZZZZ